MRGPFERLLRESFCCAQGDKRWLGAADASGEWQRDSPR